LVQLSQLLGEHRSEWLPSAAYADQHEAFQVWVTLGNFAGDASQSPGDLVRTENDSHVR
jgi:hypothetical protein